MKKSILIPIILAASLILIGCIIFGSVMTMLNWDFKKLSTVSYETNSYDIDKDVKAIQIETDTADVTLVPSEDGRVRVECVEQKKVTHTVTSKDGVLSIRVSDTRRWYEHIGISFSSNTSITLFVPEGEYGDLDISLSTGDVKIPEGYTFEDVSIKSSTGKVSCKAWAQGNVNITASTGNITLEGTAAKNISLAVSTGRIDLSDIKCAGELKVTVSTGDATLSNVNCTSLRSNGSTGKLKLSGVIAENSFSIERSTGDVILEGSDAAEMHIETDTGDVSGTLLSEKVFIVDTDTGRVNVPDTTSGGTCKISTDTGDIKISIKD